MTILITDEGDIINRKYSTPLAYCQKETYKGYAKRTPFVKNIMACYMTNMADSTC